MILTPCSSLWRRTRKGTSNGRTHRGLMPLTWNAKRAHTCAAGAGTSLVRRCSCPIVDTLQRSAPAGSFSRACSAPRGPLEQGQGRWFELAVATLGGFPAADVEQVQHDLRRGVPYPVEGRALGLAPVSTAPLAALRPRSGPPFDRRRPAPVPARTGPMSESGYRERPTATRMGRPAPHRRRSTQGALEVPLPGVGSASFRLLNGKLPFLSNGLVTGVEADDLVVVPHRPLRLPKLAVQHGPLAQ